jgi:uncharacterized membrane protein HdeD (DUF308 family)
MNRNAVAANEQRRWLSIVSGLVMIVAGLVTWLRPEWFVPFVGAVAIVEGIQLAWEGLFNRRGDGLDGGRVAIGVLAVVLGAALWIYPDKAAPVVFYLISGWAIIFGAFMAILGFKDRGAVPGWAWEVLIGLLLVVLGIATWVVPQEGAMAFAHVFSVIVVLAGIARLGSAVQAG